MNKSSRVALLTILFSVSASMLATDAPIAGQTDAAKTETIAENKVVTNEAKAEDKTPEIKSEDKAPLATNAPVTTIEDKKDTAGDKKADSYLAKITGLPVAAFGAIIATPNFIADKTYLNSLISKITGVKYLKGSFVDKPELIGQAIVIAAAAYAAYVAYNMINTEEIVDTDDFFVAEDNN
jgi:hypothetical protein